jgi:hypothetical protein
LRRPARWPAAARWKRSFGIGYPRLPQNQFQPGLTSLHTSGVVKTRSECSLLNGCSFASLASLAVNAFGCFSCVYQVDNIQSSRWSVTHRNTSSAHKSPQLTRQVTTNNHSQCYSFS